LACDGARHHCLHTSQAPDKIFDGLCADASGAYLVFKSNKDLHCEDRRHGATAKVFVHSVPSSDPLILSLPPSPPLVQTTMPPIRHKRKQDSSSSGSSSSTIRNISVHKRQARPLAEKPFVSGGKYRRAKKRSKLTGLATPFFVRQRVPVVSTGQLSSTLLYRTSTYMPI
jgi:hypothetical protein